MQNISSTNRCKKQYFLEEQKQKEPMAFYNKIMKKQ